MPSNAPSHLHNLVYAAIFCLLSPTSEASLKWVEHTGCTPKTRLSANGTASGGLGDGQCFEVVIPEEGLLTLEASGPLLGPGEVRLTSDSGCGSSRNNPKAVPLLELPSSWALWVEERGLVPVCVTPQDLDASIEGFRLVSAFAPLTETSLVKAFAPTGGDPEEDEPDPLPLEVSSLIPYCGPLIADDHRDTTFCATSIPLSSAVSAELNSDADQDYFTFELKAVQVLEVSAEGEGVLTATLLDAKGHPLATDSGETGAGARLVKALAKGRYYLRVVGMVGSYSVVLTVRD